MVVDEVVDAVVVDVVVVVVVVDVVDEDVVVVVATLSLMSEVNGDWPWRMFLYSAKL